MNNMKAFWCFFLSVLMLSLTACGDTTQLSPIAKSDKILAFGDSLTYGTGAEPSKSYPNVLAELIGRTVINAGVPGEISAVGKKRLKRYLVKHKPTLVILCHGGNDLIQKHDNEETSANLTAMIKMSRDSGAEVLLLSVPKPSILLKPAPFYEAIAEETNTPAIIGLMSDILTDRTLKSDTAHPNTKGYAKIAKTIQAFLEEKGALSKS